VDWVIKHVGVRYAHAVAAWAATGRPLAPGHGLVLLAFCPLFCGLYLSLTYQFDEDRRRRRPHPRA